MSDVMKIVAYILVVLVVIGISFYLCIRDFDKLHDTKEDQGEDGDALKNTIPKTMILFFVTGVVLNVFLVFWLGHFYHDNRWLYNAKHLCLISLIWYVAYIDYKTLRIPNSYIFAGLIFRVFIFGAEIIHGEYNPLATIASELLTALFVFIACVICRMIVKNGIGFGDVKLLLIMSLYLGPQGLPSAVMMALITSFFAAMFLVFRKKKGRNDVIPFGPFIVLGTYFSLLLTGA